MRENCSLLEIRGLSASYDQNGTEFPILEDVSFAIEMGRSLGVVGESGSGKSTLAKCIVQLLPLSSGHILWQGSDIAQFGRTETMNLKTEMQMIFQDPGGSLNPYMKAGSIIGEPLLVHGRLNHKEREKEIQKLIEQVGLQASDAQKYPHEFSGGQKQRIAIARALSLKPSLLVCDEPTSALDVSVQATILNLLSDLQEEYALTMLFISHDIAVVHHICDEVLVLDKGKVIEYGATEDVIHAPEHPITIELIESC